MNALAGLAVSIAIIVLSIPFALIGGLAWLVGQLADALTTAAEFLLGMIEGLRGV